LIPGTTRVNVVSMFTLTFITALYFYIKTGALTYLLVNDYGVSTSDSTQVSSSLNLYGTIAMVPCDLMSGVLLDLVSRRLLIAVTMSLCGFFLIMQTLFSEVYPTLLLVFIMYAILAIPGFNAPYTSIFISKQSYGTMNIYSSFVNLLGSSIATSVTINLQTRININYIFDAYGVLIIILSCLIGLGLNESKIQRHVVTQT
jgi:MFS family permease